MSEWRGLHEQDYHSPWLDGIRALCTICQQDCEADDVCYCCQRNAEVERLTADLADRNRRIEEALAFLHHPTEVNGCTCLAHQIAATLRGTQ